MVRFRQTNSAPMTRRRHCGALAAVQALGRGSLEPLSELGAGIAHRSDGLSTRWAKALCLGALAAGLLIAGFGPAAPSAVAASTTIVDLGQASTYAVLSGASVANTVNAPGAPHTTLRGDLGVKANAQPLGFPPGVVTGTIRAGSPAAQAYDDLGAAYA